MIGKSIFANRILHKNIGYRMEMDSTYTPWFVPVFLNSGRKVFTKRGSDAFLSRVVMIETLIKRELISKSIGHMLMFKVISYAEVLALFPEDGFSVTWENNIYEIFPDGTECFIGDDYTRDDLKEDNVYGYHPDDEERYEFSASFIYSAYLVLSIIKWDDTGDNTQVVEQLRELDAEYYKNIGMSEADILEDCSTRLSMCSGKRREFLEPLLPLLEEVNSILMDMAAKLKRFPIPLKMYLKVSESSIEKSLQALQDDINKLLLGG